MTASVSLVRSDLVIVGAGTEGAVARLIATKPAQIINYQFDYQFSNPMQHHYYTLSIIIAQQI